MKAKDLKKIGMPDGPELKAALRLIGPATSAGYSKADFLERVKAVLDDPSAFAADSLFAPLAEAVQCPYSPETRARLGG